MRRTSPIAASLGALALLALAELPTLSVLSPLSFFPSLSPFSFFPSVSPRAPLAFAGGDPSLDALRRRLDDDDPAGRASAVRRLASSMAGTPDEPALRLVVRTLADKHPTVRRAAAGVLGVVLDPAARARLSKEGAAWPAAVPRASLVETFAAWADRDGRTGLLRFLADADAGVRAAVAEALSADPDDAAGRALLLATSDPDGLVRASAVHALVVRRDADGGTRPSKRGAGGGSGAGGATGEVPWRALSKDRDPRVRLAALEGSVAVGGETAVFAVEHGLDDAVWSVRFAAAELAGTVRDRRVLAPLIAALRDPRDRVAGAAGAALVRLTGIPFDADTARWTSWLEGDGAAFDPATVEPRKAATGFDAGGKTVAAVKFLKLPLASAHVTFVLDASGSMAVPDAAGVSRWDRVRAELDRVLLTLGTAAEGNVVVFSDEAVPLFPSAVRFSPAVRAHVTKALAARPPSGKTALFDGIARALEDPVIDSVVVLSDGAPSAGSWFTKTELRSELLRANRWRRARIDVISVGGDEVAKRWRSLLADIASDHGGRLIGP